MIIFYTKYKIFSYSNNLSIKVTEDEGFEDASDELSTSSVFSDDSGIHGLQIWDEALKLKPSRFYTWEGRKQM